MSTTPSLKTRQLYNQIRFDLITLHYRLKLLYQIYNTREIIDMLERWAPILFFRVFYYDAIDAISIGISRLLDRGATKYGARASLYTFVSYLRHLDKNMAAELQVDLDETKRKSRRIIHWRNYWAGHRDYRVALQLQARLIGREKSPVGFNLVEVRESLTGIGQILNKFEAKYCDAGKTTVNPTPKQAQELMYWIAQPVDYETFVQTDEGKKLIDLLRSTHQ